MKTEKIKAKDIRTAIIVFNYQNGMKDKISIRSKSRKIAIYTANNIKHQINNGVYLPQLAPYVIQSALTKIKSVQVYFPF